MALGSGDRSLLRLVAALLDLVAVVPTVHLEDNDRATVAIGDDVAQEATTTAGRQLPDRHVEAVGPLRGAEPDQAQSSHEMLQRGPVRELDRRLGLCVHVGPIVAQATVPDQG